MAKFEVRRDRQSYVDLVRVEVGLGGDEMLAGLAEAPAGVRLVPVLMHGKNCLVP